MSLLCALKNIWDKLFFIPSFKELPEIYQVSVCTQASQHSWSCGVFFKKDLINQKLTVQQCREINFHISSSDLKHVDNSQQPWVFAFMVTYNKVNQLPPYRKRFCKAVKCLLLISKTNCDLYHFMIAKCFSFTLLPTKFWDLSSLKRVSRKLHQISFDSLQVSEHHYKYSRIMRYMHALTKNESE